MPTVRVEGNRELRAALRSAQRELSKAGLKEVNLDAARVVEEEAQRQVPVQSGELKSTIRAAGQQARAVVRAGFKKTPYAGPIHFGWPGHNISPQPFIYDALDARANEVIRVYEERVNELVDKIAR